MSSRLVDSTALIFTEQDIYRIGGYLAESWGVYDHATPLVDLVDLAIQDVLASVCTCRKHAIDPGCPKHGTPK